MSVLLSICIPSYNRPQQLIDLLSSIDCDPSSVEIVICEDQSPQRDEIRKGVTAFWKESRYRINYRENETNLGYDRNIRRLVELATGRYVLFMGDDDRFVAGALARFLQFLTKQGDKKYILRSYLVLHPDRSIEPFKYLKETTVLPAGEESVAWLFKRSVSISGFTIDRELANAASTDELDGTLLYQVYLMARICYEHDSVYCDFPVAQVIQSYRAGQAWFGGSSIEGSRYSQGKITHDNSIRFSQSYFEVTDYLDRMLGTHLTTLVRKDLSKYAYPFLSIQRKKGFRSFMQYARRLEREVGINCTPHYYLYKWGLALLGERACDRLIISLKTAIGHTPNL